VVALIVVHIFTHVADALDVVLMAPFALVLATIGVKGLQFFQRNDIRRHFGET